MSDINIRIDDSFAYISYEKRGINYTKTISVDSLISSLAMQYGVKVPSLLPAGTRFYMKKGTEHILFIEIPPIPRLIKYSNRTSKTIFEGMVPMPWALLQIRCIPPDTAGGLLQVSSGCIYALKRPLIADSDALYHFPAANVGNDHHICWGSTFSDMPGFKSLAEMGRTVDYYFSSEFNQDISPRIMKYDRYEDLLRAIKDAKTFPLDVLSSSPYTFESLTNKIQ